MHRAGRSPRGRELRIEEVPSAHQGPYNKEGAIVMVYLVSHFLLLMVAVVVVVLLLLLRLQGWVSLVSMSLLLLAVVLL